MAIIKCPECGNTVSDQAANCPHCGFKVTNKIGYTENQYQGKRSSIKGMIIALCGVILIWISFTVNTHSDLNGLLFLLGIILLIVGAVFKAIGRAKHWYHN